MVKGFRIVPNGIFAMWQTSDGNSRFKISLPRPPHN